MATRARMSRPASISRRNGNAKPNGSVHGRSVRRAVRRTATATTPAGDAGTDQGGVVAARATQQGSDGDLDARATAAAERIIDRLKAAIEAFDEASHLFMCWGLSKPFEKLPFVLNMSIVNRFHHDSREIRDIWMLLDHDWSKPPKDPGPYARIDEHRSVEEPGCPREAHNLEIAGSAPIRGRART